MSSKQSKSPQAFEITEARPGDEADICRLIHALALYEKAPEQCTATGEQIREQLFCKAPTAHAYVARCEGEVVAFALYFLSFSTWLACPGLYLEDLFVLPDYRKLGIGRALLRRLARLCVVKGYGRMEWACLEWNELAKAQYRKIGANPMEEWRTWRLTGDELGAFADSELSAPKQELELDLKIEEDPKPELTQECDFSEVTVYTDGGCRPNPGVGGWAAVLICGDTVKELSGGEAESTNNRMEMTAAIMALETLKRPCKVTLNTDSSYVKNGITKWIFNWKKKNWKRGPKGNEPVLNVDLWKRLDSAIQRHEIKWCWVPGHAGVEYNELCDELCTKEINKLS